MSDDTGNEFHHIKRSIEKIEASTQPASHDATDDWVTRAREVYGVAVSRIRERLDNLAKDRPFETNIILYIPDVEAMFAAMDRSEAPRMAYMTGYYEASLDAGGYWDYQAATEGWGQYSEALGDNGLPASYNDDAQVAREQNVYRLQMGGKRLCEALRLIADGCENPAKVALDALNHKAPDPDWAAVSSGEVQ